MHPDHINFSILPGLVPNFVSAPERNEERKIFQFVLPISTHWSMMELSLASPLKETESFPTCTPIRNHQL